MENKPSTMDPDQNLDACFETVMKLVDEAGEVSFIRNVCYLKKNN